MMMYSFTLGFLIYGGIPLGPVELDDQYGNQYGGFV